jgi:hypothetical protein
VANLSNLIAKIPGGGVTRTQGVMVLAGGALAVNVWGNVIPARYADPLVVNAGDTVVVDLMAGPTGQAEAVVSGKLTAAPRPGTGTVTTVPPASATITVTGTDGTAYTAYFVSSYTPTVNDNVILAWNAATPTVTGKVGATPTPAPPPSPVAPPPPPSSTGTSTYAATDSGAWSSSYGWDNWAGGGGNVFEGGSAYGASNNGAWFYAGSPGELAGRTITRIRFNTGARRSVGSYNSAVTVNFYAHTSPNKPGGDVSRTVGPTGISIPPGFNGTIDLPLSFAPVLQAGGGIAIAGEPYTGFNGRNTQPDSGLLTIDWSR